jgi:hypothetical protein
MKKAALSAASCGSPLRRIQCAARPQRTHAAVSHIAVSNALLIIGMFMPKVLFVALFTAGLAGLSAMLWATSVARSHDPCSWERATEKNRNT